MIGEYTLKMLCEKYKLNSEKLVNKNSNILKFGEYKKINQTLNYLINELCINPCNIEKCPSILYKNVGNIKQNVIFLKHQKIVFKNIESCLHVLYSEPNELIETYNYVKDNYNENAINKYTSILSVSKTIIIDVEKLKIPFKNKIGNLQVACGISQKVTNLEEVKKIIQSPEFEAYPELFTSQILARRKYEEIQAIIQSPEFKSHPELFTSRTLAYGKYEEIQAIIQSPEFKSHPELFTSDTFSGKLNEIQEMIQSPEFKSHPELFTSQTLAYGKYYEIQKIIQSPEFKSHPELFTSQTLAHRKYYEIQKLLQMECWKDERFEKLLTSSIVAKSKSMITKLPILIQIAEKYSIDKYLNTSFLLFSPSQNYALIQYLNENHIPLIVDGKLNSVFGKQPGVLKKKYNIDIYYLIDKYPLRIDKINDKSGAKIKCLN